MSTSVSMSGRDGAFSSWLSMMKRCFLTAEPIYKHYGGRGITVCERWHDWRKFIEDMGGRPDGLSLDRIDVNGNYEPGNCRWADSRTQSRNRRNNTWVEVDGVAMVASDAAALLGVSPSAVSRRRSSAKVSLANVKQIKEMLAAGHATKAIAADLGFTRQQVQGIRDGRVWRVA